MYGVELYARVRRACHVERMSIREASRMFGVARRTVAKMLAPTSRMPLSASIWAIFGLFHTSRAFSSFSRWVQA